MKTRPIPNTDLELSVVGFGCWAIGGLWWGNDVRDPDSRAAIETALEQGINWFDTAPLYGHGHADEVLVDALGARRHDVVIATKVGVRWDGKGKHATSDLSPDHIRSDTEASLRRLKLDSIPLLQVHWPCERGTSLRASLDTLQELQAEGKIQYFGLCNYDAQPLEEAMVGQKLATLQTPYSMLRREFDRSLANSVCGRDPEQKTPQIGVLAYETLCRGLLTGKFKTVKKFPASDLRARDDRFKSLRFLRTMPFLANLEKVSQRISTPPGAIAIAWALNQRGISHAIVGAKRPQQVIENAMASSLLDHRKLWPVVARVLNTYRG